MIFDLANLPYWIFLGTGILLFLFVILSGGGDDDLEVDTEVDLDADLDIEADLDTDVETNPVDLDADSDGELSLGQVLAWFGIGRAPLILLLALDLSIWGLGGWLLNVAIAEITGQIPLGFGAGGVLVLSLAIALLIGSLVSRPVGKVFAAFSEDASEDRLIGCVGRVVSAALPFESSSKIGQVDVIDAARNLVTVSAVIPDWANITVRRGANVIVIDRTVRSYLVIAQDSLDQERWLAGDIPQKP
ncbi:DUF1449 domain-containing protein [Almyronema epifaneia]|uniref:DUF1449 domain-containing protein n=1 Tax=Almyronema epifaneia S1 TaxID=2991925 RepID=A0ABW6IGP6_9CYAN